MHFLLSVILSLALGAGPTGQQATTPQRAEKVPQAWDPKTIEWQKVDSDGTKWSVLAVFQERSYPKGPAADVG